ncbi:MAG: phosphatase PAP2 family protein [Fimbriimonas sp.]
MRLLYDLDQSVFRAIHVGWRSEILTPIFWLFSYSGLGWLQGLVALAMLRWERTKHYTLPLLVTIIFSGLVVAQGIKKLMPRDRPSNLAVSIPQEEFFGNSFPSGHTTTSFAFATMLLLMTWGSRNAAIGRWAMVWAFAVGVSRVFRGVHWPTDAMAGACAGVFASCVVYLVLRHLGRITHLDTPSATLSGAEAARDA